MPDVPAPDTLPDFKTRMAPHRDLIGDWYDRPRPIDLRYARRRSAAPAPRAELSVQQRGGCGPTGGCPTIPCAARRIVTYASDMTLLDDACCSASVWPSATTSIQMASLDHAMWFHRPFRADDWLLYDQITPTTCVGPRVRAPAASTRSAATSWCSVVQEGMIRAAPVSPCAAKKP